MMGKVGEGIMGDDDSRNIEKLGGMPRIWSGS